jgi:glycine/D-amino acid oxidase-like deaminating enzyme
MRVGVVGGGAFGMMSATRLAEAGESVTLFDRLPGLMQGASANANRLHQGFHYPRDEETARMCLRGFRRFREDFSEAILGSGANRYCVASEGSRVSAAEFLAFCDRLQLPYRILDLDRLRPAVAHIDLAVATEETVYAPAVLRRLMAERVRRAGVEVRVGSEVVDLVRHGSGGFEIVTGDERRHHVDVVVNCSYGDVNRLTARLGHAVEPRQYEYAVAAVMSLLPFDDAGRYVLYHVEHAVVARQDHALLERSWLEPASSPFARLDAERWFAAQLASCQAFVPALREARLAGFLHGPRMVLADRESTDARPSIVTEHESGYLTVFAGKVDHCLWVADEVAAKLGCLVAA